MTVAVQKTKQKTKKLMNGKWERVNYNWANKKMDGRVCLFSLLDPLGSVRQSSFTISMSSL